MRRRAANFRSIAVQIDVSDFKGHVGLGEIDKRVVPDQSSFALVAVLLVLVLGEAGRGVLVDVVVDEGLAQFVFYHRHGNQILDAFGQEVLLQQPLDARPFLGVFVEHLS